LPKWLNVLYLGQGRLSLPITDYHAKYFAHELTIQHGNAGIDRLSQSLFDASVDLNPHQIEAALFALRYDTIYVNGSNNLPNLKKDDENWKVCLIEDEFHKKMWEVGE